VAGVHALGDSVPIEGDDARKMVTVLRKRTGDRIEVIDSATQRFGAILNLDGRSLRATLVEGIAGGPEAPSFSITVAQAIPKGRKMDFIIEKLTELGVADILPFFSERTIVDRAERKLERWQRIVKSAAQQCGRARIPPVAPPQRLPALLERFASFDRVLVAWELAENRLLRDHLPPLLAGAHSVLVVVGPEGGFSSVEAATMRSHGAQLVSLGPRILRTETAALVVVAILNYIA